MEDEKCSSFNRQPANFNCHHGLPIC
jgi:hypothetical protein